MWQILLFLGLLFWYFLVVRAVRPALKTSPEHRSLIWLFLVSAGAIGLLYGAGLNWGQHTHLSMLEYWRWWVVHLRVEGFFEVFATTVIAFFFARLHLIRPEVALAWGSVFSALEVVPLTMVAFSALDDLRRGTLTPWAVRYKWPIRFFVAGAALFGVYGMLGMGLMLVCLRALQPDAQWKEGRLKFAFWSMNIGLFAMCVGSLLPVGLLQTWASVDKGYWYARSTEFLGTPLMQTLRWMRVPGDTLFAAGALVLVHLVLTSRSRRA